MSGALCAVGAMSDMRAMIGPTLTQESQSATGHAGSSSRIRMACVFGKRTIIGMIARRSGTPLVPRASYALRILPKPLK